MLLSSTVCSTFSKLSTRSKICFMDIKKEARKMRPGTEREVDGSNGIVFSFSNYRAPEENTEHVY